MQKESYPLGFGLALAMDPDALRNFAILPQTQKDRVLSRARGISSRGEMQSLIQELSHGGPLE